jgi:hypothetical protein
MESPRWLFPFTHGVDMQAIDTVVRLAEGSGATLVAVSLIAVPPERQSQGARLEYIQQSKDFLEAVKFKAGRHKVSIERYEAFTRDVLGSIMLLTHDQHCESIVLVSCGEQDILLTACEKKCLLEDPPASLVILRLSAQAGRTRHAYTRFLSWLHRLWEGRDVVDRVQYTPKLRGLSWVRTEEHHRG